MAAVANGIDETRVDNTTNNTVQLNGLFGKTFIFIMCHSQSATPLPVHSFVSSFVNVSASFILLFLTLNISQGFSLNFARTLKDAQLTSCWMVQGLLHTGSLFLKVKARVCFEATRLSNKTEGVISHILRTWSELDCSVQRRKWSPTANDPQTGNDPQIGPQMIPNRKWSPMWTANDPAGKGWMAWSFVSRIFLNLFIFID